MPVNFLALATFVLVTTFTPGPNNISSAALGVSQGYARTLRYLLGITAGFFLVMLACAFLSRLVLAYLPLAEEYVRWIGAAYILWLAWGVLGMRVDLENGREMGHAFAKGLMLQVVNPKALVFGLTLFSTFLAPVAGHTGALLLAVAGLSVVTFTAVSTWALGGAAIRNWFANPAVRRAVNIVLSLLLVYTAIDISGIAGR